MAGERNRRGLSYSRAGSGQGGQEEQMRRKAVGAGLVLVLLTVGLVNAFFRRSIWPLSCHPAMAPSGLITHAVICKPRSVTRSVPRITATRANLAASATAAHARSRKAGSGDGAS